MHFRDLKAVASAVICLAVNYCHAQISIANNGLTASGTGNNTVSLGGTLNKVGTRVIVSDVNGDFAYRDASTLGSGGSVSGATNYITKYSSGTAIRNSLLYDNGTNVGVSTATPNSNATLDVNGNIFSSGKIAIGTTDMAKMGTFSLAVNGDAIFKKVKVNIYANRPDYVFYINYELRSLKELENFIQQNKHFPDGPSAADVEKNGVDLGINQSILL